MDFGVINGEPYYKRLPLDRDTVHKITSFGIDNLYPQRMLEVLFLSTIGKSAVNLLASFVRGDGFEKGDKVINENGETANDILRLVSLDKSTFDGYGLHVNSNALGVAKEIQYINFEFIRLGLANQRGHIKDVRVSNNWEGISNELPNPNDLNAIRYVIYDPETVGAETLRSDKGTVLYSSPMKGVYPLATFDACIESLQSDHELQNFELGNIVNGFLGLSIFKYPSGGNTEDEEKELTKKLNKLKGAKNANSIIVASIDEDWEGGNLVEGIPALNNDSLFINTTLNVKNRILQNYALPASLMGMLPAGALFTAQQIRDDFLYMNARTRDTRLEIERTFDKLGLDVGKIIPREFDISETLEQTPLDNGT